MEIKNLIENLNKEIEQLEKTIKGTTKKKVVIIEIKDKNRDLKTQMLQKIQSLKKILKKIQEKNEKE